LCGGRKGRRGSESDFSATTFQRNEKSNATKGSSGRAVEISGGKNPAGVGRWLVKGSMSLGTLGESVGGERDRARTC